MDIRTVPVTEWVDASEITVISCSDLYRIVAEQQMRKGIRVERVVDLHADAYVLILDGLDYEWSDCGAIILGALSGRYPASEVALNPPLNAPLDADSERNRAASIAETERRDSITIPVDDLTEALRALDRAVSAVTYLATHQRLRLAAALARRAGSSPFRSGDAI